MVVTRKKPPYRHIRVYHPNIMPVKFCDTRLNRFLEPIANAYAISCSRKTGMTVIGGGLNDLTHVLR